MDQRGRGSTHLAPLAAARSPVTQAGWRVSGQPRGEVFTTSGSTQQGWDKWTTCAPVTHPARGDAAGRVAVPGDQAGACSGKPRRGGSPTSGTSPNGWDNGPRCARPHSAWAPPAASRSPVTRRWRFFCATPTGRCSPPQQHPTGLGQLDHAAPGPHSALAPLAASPVPVTQPGCSVFSGQPRRVVCSPPGTPNGWDNLTRLRQAPLCPGLRWPRARSPCPGRGWCSLANPAGIFSPPHRSTNRADT